MMVSPSPPPSTSTSATATTLPQHQGQGQGQGQGQSISSPTDNHTNLGSHNNPRFNQFIQSITQASPSSAVPPSSFPHPPQPQPQPQEQYRRAQPTAWSSPAPSSNGPSFGSPSPVRSLADYSPDVSALLAGPRSAAPASPTALTSPWLWNRRPVDTRHLPVPRPLPPVYSDLRRMRAPPLELREPWQRWLQVGTLALCGTLAVYTALYLPIEEEDLMHNVRRWWFGSTYQPNRQMRPAAAASTNPAHS